MRSVTRIDDEGKTYRIEGVVRDLEDLEDLWRGMIRTCVLAECRWHDVPVGRYLNWM